MALTYYLIYFFEGIISQFGSFYFYVLYYACKLAAGFALTKFKCIYTQNLT